MEHSSTVAPVNSLLATGHPSVFHNGTSGLRPASGPPAPPSIGELLVVGDGYSRTPSAHETLYSEPTNSGSRAHPNTNTPAIGNAEPQVLVLPHPLCPADERGLFERCYYPLSTALTTVWPSDAHFAQYCRPDVPRRLKQADLAWCGSVTLPILALDFDDPVAHSRVDGVARPDWVQAELGKMAAIQTTPGLSPFIYQSRRGLRMVWRLWQPFVIAGEHTWAEWRRRYIHVCVWLFRQHGLIADPPCKPPVQLFRLPRVTRDDTIQDLPCWGDATKIAFLDLNLVVPPTPEDMEAVRLLQHRYGNWNKAVAEFGPLARARASRAIKPKRPITAGPIAASPTAQAIADTLIPVVARYQDGRHDLYLALAGALCEAGHAALAEDIVHRVAFGTGDPKLERRVSDARSTVTRHTSGLPVTGWSTLCGSFVDLADAMSRFVAPVAAFG